MRMENSKSGFSREKWGTPLPSTKTPLIYTIHTQNPEHITFKKSCEKSGNPHKS